MGDVKLRFSSSISDDQLRAECERRGIDFARELNNEARRYDSASARCIELEKERDELKRRANATLDSRERKHKEIDELKALLTSSGALWRGMSASYWASCSDDFEKRHRDAHRDLVAAGRELDAANAKLAIMEDKYAKLLAKTAVAEISYTTTAVGGCAVCGATPGSPCTKDCDDDSVPDEKVRRVEEDVSRGIRTLDLRPDNSVAWLDEDLLCEDA